MVGARLEETVSSRILRLQERESQVSTKIAQTPKGQFGWKQPNAGVGFTAGDVTEWLLAEIIYQNKIGFN